MKGFLKKLELPPGNAAPTELAYDDIVATAITAGGRSSPRSCSPTTSMSVGG